MKEQNKIINEILELYEFHKKESEKYSTILGILRGTPDDNKIKAPVALPAEKQTLPPPTGLKVSELKPKKMDVKPENRVCKDPRCKKKFVPFHKRQVYCSDECSNRGSVYLNYLKKKNKKDNEDNEQEKEPAAPGLDNKDKVMYFDTPDPEKKNNKKHKHLQAESFYNGKTTMP
jgi:hypothetical protein